MTKIVETSAALAAIRKSLRYRAGAVLSGGILGEEFAPVLARVARDLVEDLEMYAERHKRTLNGEIISRLPPMARLKWRVAQHESRHLTRVLLLAQSWADLPTVQGFGARDEIARFRSEPLEEGRESTPLYRRRFHVNGSERVTLQTLLLCFADLSRLEARCLLDFIDTGPHVASFDEHGKQHARELHFRDALGYLDIAPMRSQRFTWQSCLQMLHLRAGTPERRLPLTRYD